MKYGVTNTWEDLLGEAQFSLALEGVSKIYPGSPPVEALVDITMTVRPGEFLGVVGSSGSGKSTLLHVVGTLTRPTTGTVLIGGINTWGLNDTELSGIRAHNIGFVFQDFMLMSGFSALENVENGLLYLGVNRYERRHKSMEILDRVGLKQRMNHMPNQLSGGEQQRVAIARALVNNPAFVLADEPTGNLDSYNTGAIMQLLKDLNREGATVILITHDLEVASHSSRQIVLKDGRIESDSGIGISNVD